MTQDKKFLGTEPVGRLLWRLAVPTVIAQLVNMLYNIVDRIYIGHIPETGSMALTGVGVCLPIIMIISAFAAFVSSGGAPRASIAMGRGDYDQAQRILGGCFTLQVAISLVLTAVLLIWNRPLLLTFGASGNTIEYAAQYMGVYALGTLFVELTLGLNAFITAQGFAQVGMKTVLIGAVANILLDPLFIFVLDMGVAGAALATIISQFVSFCLLIAGTFRGGNLRLNLKDFSPSLKYYQNIVKGGAPSLFRQGLGSFATVCLNLMAGPYGDAAIAAMSIVTRISQFAASVVIGFGQGFQPVCGFNYGAKLFKRVQEGFWFCVKFCTSVLLVAAVCGWIFSPNLIGIFLKTDPLVIEYGLQALRLQALTFPLVGWITIANMMLQTIGKTVKASLLAMSRQFLFFVPVILTLPGFLGILGVQLSQPIADFCSFLLAVLLSISVLREMSHEQEQLEQLKITREN